MLQLTTTKSIGTTASYATTKNSRFKNTQSDIKSIQERWDETYNNLPIDQQQAIDIALQAAKDEFKRRHPNLKNWNDLKKELALAIDIPMSSQAIDGTMQRLLNIEWVLELLNTFVSTKVSPIQVYQPNPDEELYLVWDSQHTLVLLWLIATQIFETPFEDIKVPANIYSSHKKHEMRQSFVDLNGPVGKKGLDLFDLFEQMVYGVRVDHSDDPLWVTAEKKQTILEKNGLFVTSKKFGDHDQPGAISRMQEINKLSPEAVGWLCEYLVAVGAQTRPAEEKEMVMMGYFFERCRLARIKVNSQYIQNVATTVLKYWNADFGPNSTFWVRANNAYKNWHAKHIVYGKPKFSKEPVHGYPFFIEQLKKDFPNVTHPENRSTSEFVPAAEDLF